MPNSVAGNRPRVGRGLRRGSVVVLGGLILAVLVAVTPAWAYWRSSGKGLGASTTGTLAPPTSVLVPATSSPTVPVSWTAPTGTPAATGYYLTRTSGGVTVAACASSPSTLLTGTSCNDAAVSNGSYTYQVTAVYRTWSTAGTSSGTVTVSNATKVAFTTQPSTTAATASITPAVAVTVQTATGSTVTIGGIVVSLAISTNPGGGTLSGTTTANTSTSGVATFSALSIDKAGAGYQLTATSSGLTSATSVAFTVTAGSPAALIFTTAPTASFAGQPFYTQPVVTLHDAGGNVATTGTNTVTLTLTSPGGATLTCPATAAVAGTATFSGCTVNNPGTYTLTAASGTLTTAVSASFTVVAAPTNLAWTGPTTTVCTSSSGTSFALAYHGCAFVLSVGTLTSGVSLTNTAGTAITNLGADVIVTLTTAGGTATPATLTIPHGQSVSSATTKFSPGFPLIISATITANATSVTAATAVMYPT